MSISPVAEIREKQDMTREQLGLLLTTEDEKLQEELRRSAREVADEIYGKQVFIRGLIEFTNYCRNDCLYCGIRRSNAHASRYRLSKDEILSCCKTGYELGFRTFVLQGGEDRFFTDERNCDILSSIKERYPDCAITLSI